MKKIAILALISLALFSLAACGVDGEPTPPEPVAKNKPGIAITGRAEIGIARRS